MRVKPKDVIHNNILIIGAGAAGLTLASKLVDEGVSDIGIYSLGHGASPLIAGINFLTDDSSEERNLYIQDMLKAGYYSNNQELVDSMVNESKNAFDFLNKIKVEFSMIDGDYRKRHLSGHSKPRTLCNTEEFIGKKIIGAEKKFLKENGIDINLGFECIDIIESDGKRKARFIKSGDVVEIIANTIVIAWGGIGDLIGISTYPKDVYGNTIGIAKELDFDMVDLEFIEFEPMVVLYPESVRGEPCPTAMLGEGANLLNSEGEKFLLKVLDTEVGAPKSIINREIQREVSEGRGSPYGGVWVDLRHIPEEVLKGYPWFYNLLKAHGVDLKNELLNVGPVKHSFSGGIKVDKNYKIRNGFYAIGEAAGGIHGACRCAGNGGAQSVVSGYIAAKDIVNELTNEIYREDEKTQVKIKIDEEVFQRYKKELIALGDESLGYIKNISEMESNLVTINELLKEEMIKEDIRSYQAISAYKMILEASLLRNETIGSFVIK